MAEIHKLFLAGVLHADAHLIVGAIPEGTPLILKREPNNPYDPDAVSVWISAAEIKKAGLVVKELGASRDPPHWKLGMLPASRGPDWASRVAKILDAGGEVIAKFRRHQSESMIRITIESGDIDALYVGQP